MKQYAIFGFKLYVEGSKILVVPPIGHMADGFYVAGISIEEIASIAPKFNDALSFDNFLFAHHC